MTPWLNGYQHECERCGEVTEPKYHHLNKKYCTRECQVKASSERVAERVRTDPEFHARVNARNRESGRRSRADPFVAVVRECDWCLTPFTAKQRHYRFCSPDCNDNWDKRQRYFLTQFTDPDKYREYRERRNADHKRYRERMMADGRCRDCGKPSDRVGMWRCSVCGEKNSIRNS